MTKPAIILLHGDGREKEIRYVDKELIIGRDKSADIHVKVASISRQHAKVELNSNGVLCFYHLSKVNPSIVNQEVVRDSLVLKHGDIIQLGELLFEVHYPGRMLECNL